MKSGIYKITHLETGKVYVGSAVHLATRWRQHRSQLSRGVHHSLYLQNAWTKHGAEAFEFSVLEHAERETLIAREQFWIDALRAASDGYNLLPTAGSPLGRVHTPETKAKMSAWQTGRKLPPETIEKLKTSNVRVISPETKAKLSAALKGRPKSAETRAKMKASYEWRGWKPTAAMIDASRRAHTGKKMSAEHVAKAVANRAASVARRAFEQGPPR